MSFKVRMKPDKNANVLGSTPAPGVAERASRSAVERAELARIFDSLRGVLSFPRGCGILLFKTPIGEVKFGRHCSST